MYILYIKFNLCMWFCTHIRYRNPNHIHRRNNIINVGIKEQIRNEGKIITKVDKIIKL